MADGPTKLQCKMSFILFKCIEEDLYTTIDENMRFGPKNTHLNGYLFSFQIPSLYNISSCMH